MTHLLDDQALVLKYMETQRPEYFSELYERYSDKVYGKCLTILRDPMKAEDAAQDIFMKIFTKLSSFNSSARFSTWIYAITYNYCIDLVRKQKRQAAIDGDESEGVNVAAEEVSDRELMEMEIVSLRKAMDKIPFDDREILIMKYREDMSIKEICEILDKSESAVKMKLLRAKQRVKENYAAVGAILLAITLLVLWICQ
jgi:RNA polymerase sigma factor (sigma-70 family)